MSKALKIDTTNIERVSLPHFAEKAYLDYSMYVILDRALPALADGLKPVQRRIVYAMSELGLSAAQKYKKSARTIGDVIGKFHPHGDSACYEAMVLMAQSFSYRYPLVDGQGNWGSMDDPKSFAAMRYTESRLTKYAEILLGELGQGTVDWSPNFDATLDEPKLLPAQLPNVLLNGGMGIAVGMSTDIPPHNAKEIINALLLLLDNPDASLSDVLKKVPAPDYPTEAEIITPRQELKKIYETGNGTLKARAVYTVEDGNIVVTALPYQVSGAKILEQIAAQMRAKKLPLVTDLRDESDHENPTRLVIEPKSAKTDIEPLMTHLFATTDLERTYRVNLNMIGLDGKPRVYNLKTLLTEWLVFRRDTVLKRLQFRLNKVDARLHLLEGFLIAYLNIDEVIRIIREKDKPKEALMQRFALTEIQADAILDLKLRNLAKLEEIEIKSEQKALAQEKKTLQDLINSPAKLTGLIKSELETLSEKYGDKRRSPIVEREEARAFKQSDVITAEPVTIVLSEKGWIRAAKGHEVKPLELSYKSGDEYLQHILAKTNDTLIVFDSTGRAYAFSAFDLPSARGFGDPLTSLLKPPSGAHFVGMMVYQEESKVLLMSDQGYGFLAPMSEMVSKNKAGKTIVKLAPEAKLMTPHVVSTANQMLAMATKDGHLLVIQTNALPELPRGKGVKLISLPKEKDALLVANAVIDSKANLALEAGARQKLLSLKEWQAYVGERGRRGLKMPRGFQTVDRLVQG